MTKGLNIQAIAELMVEEMRSNNANTELSLEDIESFSLRIYMHMLDMDKKLKDNEGHTVGWRHVFTALLMGITMAKAGVTIKNDNSPDLEFGEDEWGNRVIKEKVS